jgi:16S rRNA (uracil1498-N3)-methyltransferase
MVRVLIRSREDDRVLLPDDELHHLVRVRRVREGSLFEALDLEEGVAYLCTLSREGKQWFGQIVEILKTGFEPKLEITLVQALIKKDRFEWVIQKATELGVTQIIPLITHRTEIRLNDHRERKKIQRWNRITVEAVKQCGRTKLPSVSSPVSLKEIIHEVSDSPRFVCDESAQQPLSQVLKGYEGLKACMLFIGPEGGWDEQDRLLFREVETDTVKLGPRILRAETAAITALSILQYELGDIGR